jgi:hypothetical protein
MTPWCSRATDYSVTSPSGVASRFTSSELGTAEGDHVERDLVEQPDWLFRDPYAAALAGPIGRAVLAASEGVSGAEHEFLPIPDAVLRCLPQRRR